MRKIAFLIFFLFPFICVAQFGITSTVAGNGSVGWAGDHGPATAAQLGDPYGICIDRWGNIYIADAYKQTVRKVNTLGIITTIAGTGTLGSSGDGGPATAARLYNPHGVTVDSSGNVYIADNFNHKVRKINTSGIISTFAGNGSPGSGGDGLAAPSAALGGLVLATAIDHSGNIYVGCQNRIRKVNASGIISTVAGTGTAGYSGDGGPATAAQVDFVSDLTFDKFGNLYFCDYNNDRVRKIDASGAITTVTSAILSPYGIAIDTSGNIYVACESQFIKKMDAFGTITTIAGNGDFTFNGDGGFAIASAMYPTNVKIDNHGDLLIGDVSNSRVRKVTQLPPIGSTMFMSYVADICGGLQFSVFTDTPSTGRHVTIYINGLQYTDTFSVSGANGIATLSVPLAFSGNYSIKEILFNGSSAVDSVTFAHQHLSCENISMRFYFDANNNCVKDGSEYFAYLPVTAEVDSNGIAIDTISGTSGLNYNAFGNSGDIYTFRKIDGAGGLNISCPASGTITDTFGTTLNHNMSIGYSCGPSTSYDLSEISSSIAGRHMQSIDILAGNSFCSPQTGNLTLHFSPQYIFQSASPVPTTVTGNVVTWNTGVLTSNIPSIIHVHATLTVPGAWLTPGDTVHSQNIIVPVIGDVDTANNVSVKVDTVTGSWDPNEMSVSPDGYIAAGATLQYNIHFENTGNDTAFNIFVMDTLSDNVDPHSLRVVAASAFMNTTKYYDNTIHHTILKFEFPNINLLDSSYHDLCTGLVVFKVNARAALPDSTTIFNHAGIFFDYNPVVMTNTVENIIASIHGNSSLCIGTVDTFDCAITGGTWAMQNGHATISSGGVVTGISNGIDTVLYSFPSSNGITTISKVVSISSHGLTTIIGVDSLCEGISYLFSSSQAGGSWTTSNSHAFVTSAGLVNGLSAGGDTLIYIFSNACGADTSFKRILIKPLPNSGSITGPNSVCVGLAISLADTSVGGTWNCTNNYATVTGSGIVAGVSLGTDTVVYKVSNFCGVDSTIKIISVITTPVTSITGIDSFCQAASYLFTSSPAGGIWSTSNGHAFVSTGGLVNGFSAGTDTVIYILANSCGADSSFKNIIIKPLPHAGSITGPDSVCVGSVISLTGTAPYGTWYSLNSHATVTASGMVSGNSTGNDTIVYRVANFCGVDSATKQIVVHTTLPAGSITGPDSVCVGGAITLVDGAPSGIWLTSNSHATVSAGIVTGLTTGVDSIYFVASNTCGTNIASHVVQINQVPFPGLITGADSLCVGASVTLSASVLGGIWNITNACASITSGIVSGNVPGIDTVQYSLANSCGTGYANFQVFILSVPLPPDVSGNAYACVGSAADTLVAIPTGGTWGSSNSNAVVVGGIVSGATPGIDTIIYTITNICGTATDSFIVTIPSVETCDSLANVPGIEVIDGISIYPNPSINEITIKTSINTFDQVILIDIQGKEVIKKPIVFPEMQMNINELPGGVYYLKFIGKNSIAIRKVELL